MANNKFLEETGLSRLWSHVKKLVDTRATKIETRVTSLENQVNADKLTAYPVGAIYMSVSSTSPASLFGEHGHSGQKTVYQLVLEVIVILIPLKKRAEVKIMN